MAQVCYDLFLVRRPRILAAEAAGYD